MYVVKLDKNCNPITNSPSSVQTEELPSTSSTAKKRSLSDGPHSVNFKRVKNLPGALHLLISNLIEKSGGAVSVERIRMVLELSENNELYDFLKHTYGSVSGYIDAQPSFSVDTVDEISYVFILQASST